MFAPILSLSLALSVALVFGLAAGTRPDHATGAAVTRCLL